MILLLRGDGLFESFNLMINSTPIMS